jgi:hypothetical protein
MGTPVVFLEPRSKGAEAYKAFAWEFMAKNPTRIAVAAPAVSAASAEKSPQALAPDSPSEVTVPAPAAENAPQA